MDGPPTEEATHHIEELTLAIQDLRRRVEALERGTQSVGLPVELSRDLRPSAVESSVSEISSGLLAGIGRVLLGLAGAYLLRAVTEANLLPHLIGTLAGVLYACAWLIVFRRPSPENRWVAPLHGLTASAVLAPLLWEATIRFHTLTPSGAAAILAVFIFLGYICAWRRDSSPLAGIIALAGSVTAIALIVATLDPIPFSVALAIAAVTVEFGAWRNRLLNTRWIIALPADFCAFLLFYLLTRPQGLPEGYAPVPVTAVFAIAWVLVAVYLASTAVRTLARGLVIGWFEIGQLVTIVALAMGGTLRLMHGTGPVVQAIGAGCLVSAAACYMASGMVQARRLDRNYYAYAAFAFVLALAGSALLVAGLPLAILWSVLTLVTAWVGERRRNNLLRVHGALYLAAAAVASGLMNWSPQLGSAALMGIASALVYILILWKRGGKAPPWPERVPSAIAAGLLCWSLVGLASGSETASRLSAAFNSTLRTAVISALAIVLAWLGSRRGMKELVWLLYPWMAFGAIKLILEDFGQGQSASLFVSLLVYGAALIALPRILQRAKAAPGSPDR